MLKKNKIPDNDAVGIILGTTLSEHELKSSRERTLRSSDRNSSRNTYKTPDHISAATDLQKSLQTTPPAVGTTKPAPPKYPRTMSSPKLRSSPAPSAESFGEGRGRAEILPSLTHKLKSHYSMTCVIGHSPAVCSVQPLGTKENKAEMLQRNKDGEINRDNEEEEEEGRIHKVIQLGCSPEGSDITLQTASKCPLLPPGAATTPPSQVNETAGKTDGNAMAQERECRRQRIRDCRDGVEGREDLEERGGHDGKDREEKEKERMDQDRNSEDQQKERKRREVEEAVQDKKPNRTTSSNGAAPMTEENPLSVHTLDAALQTELLYQDAGIQAVVEVRNRSTSMSTDLTHLSRSQMDPMPNLIGHAKISGTASMKLQNGLGHDVGSGSGFVPITPASVEYTAEGLSPNPYPSFTSSKPIRQHVCQIQIELRSQSTRPDSLASQEEEEAHGSSTRSGTEKEPKQADKEGDQADTGPLPEVAWDEQGMTWEVYGAAVDMESLGFAIQNHLQRKIQEHKQHIGHLRRSVSLSEQSNSNEKRGRKKNEKRNVFRSLFRPCTCCPKTKPEA